MEFTIFERTHIFFPGRIDQCPFSVPFAFLEAAHILSAIRIGQRSQTMALASFEAADVFDAVRECQCAVSVKFSILELPLITSSSSKGHGPLIASLSGYFIFFVKESVSIGFGTGFLETAGFNRG